MPLLDRATSFQGLPQQFSIFIAVVIYCCSGHAGSEPVLRARSLHLFHFHFIRKNTPGMR
ncbi:hypothetical protein CLDAP_05950 [Caldilinea aerophila DSM 14535 = NBRC 104270]|uniref:Uncharacterized protein n=1 Tax=Caldilinea aerophila (strain DSM 14535 / JCM 11387 / NBRC 104270 / STL-6-O1) TaxID=926550 RepID=I0I047_CALAS|nr:hypothetical protein CLDAP_05950 [Caldilinea aerophila DSM 14535 = NBRC 104270]